LPIYRAPAHAATSDDAGCPAIANAYADQSALRRPLRLYVH
jgi:hypothetical protein